MYKDSAVPAVILLLAAIAWGISWLPLKGLNHLGLEGIVLIFVAHLVLLLLFMPWGFRSALIRSNIKTLAAIAVAGGTAILCFTSALIYGDVIRVMVLFYLLPVWGVLGGRLFLGETIDVVRWSGVIVALVGAFLILGGPAIVAQPPSWVDALALLSGLCFAVNNILFRGVARVPLATKLLSMFFGCVSLAALLLLLQVQSFPTAVSWRAWGWLMVYACTFLVFANIAAQWAVERLEAGQSSIILVVELVAAVISAMLIGGERLMTWEWVGCALVLAAVLLEALRVKRQQPLKVQ
ncbi:MAG: DMT family transporter [Cellvibrionaceae bacterium]|nr:DMT family transporter [Cellvibrionaceae bacterium]